MYLTLNFWTMTSSILLTRHMQLWRPESGILKSWFLYLDCAPLSFVPIHTYTHTEIVTVLFFCLVGKIEGLQATVVPGEKVMDISYDNILQPCWYLYQPSCFSHGGITGSMPLFSHPCPKHSAQLDDPSPLPSLSINNPTQAETILKALLQNSDKISLEFLSKKSWAYKWPK